MGRRGLAGLLPLAAGLALLAAAGQAQARWLRAETQRFIVYSTGDEAKLREFTAKLSNFDQVLRLMHGVKDRELDRKLEVFILSTQSDLRRTLPYGWGGILGFYSATPQAVYAMALDWRDAQGYGADDVLFHEYTHHFMLEYFPSGYPGWLVEGYAEYFGTADITPQTVDLGRYNKLRAGALMKSEWLPLREVLTVEPNKISLSRRETYYGQAWLLTHYMLIDAARARQLDAANRAFAAGAPGDKALEQATGQSVEELERQLRRHAHSKLQFRRISNPFAGQPPQITVTVLPESADELLPERLSLSLELGGDSARASLGAVRSKAKRFPGDALAELTLAQAELLYGDREAAKKILEHRLETHPKEAEALRLLGEVYLAAADKADKSQRADLLKAARPYLARAYAADGEDYRTLYDYARARALDADYPNDNTLNVLLLAVQLAPSVDEVRLKAGEALLARDRKAEAVAMLLPIAYSPHGKLQGKAAELIARARGEPPPTKPGPEKAEGG